MNNITFSVGNIFEQNCAFLAQERAYLSGGHLDRAEEIAGQQQHQERLDNAYDRFCEADSEMMDKVGELFASNDVISNVTPQMIGELICAAWTGSAYKRDWVKKLIDETCEIEAAE